MSEKLCLQWNDFQDNVKSAFGNLRESTDFADVTLACEDGHQIEAHKVVLAASSPFFQAILKRNKHSHPLIYMRGMKSNDMVAIVDFLYVGEANVYQEDLDSFLAIAEELQLKGLRNSTDEEEWKETDPKQKQRHHMMPQKESSVFCQPKTPRPEENVLAIPTTTNFSGDLQQLDETVKSMMETSQNIISDGNCQKKAKICKVCGKEGAATAIKRHIEANHFEGVSIPCNQCEKKFRTRNALRQHNSSVHQTPL